MSEPLSDPEKEKTVPQPEETEAQAEAPAEAQPEETEAQAGPTVAEEEHSIGLAVGDESIEAGATVAGKEDQAGATVAGKEDQAGATVAGKEDQPGSAVADQGSKVEQSSQDADDQDGPASWKDESELGARGTAELKTALKSSIPPPVQDAAETPPQTSPPPPTERWSISPRVHNTVVNAVAAIWMVVAVPLEDDAVVPLVALWVLHFARRTVEALFIHRYSGRRVGPSDYISESIYFWGFANWIAYGLRSPDWEPQQGVLWLIGMGLFFLGEFGSATAHLKLRSLREKSGETQRGIPRGGMFELVSSPHYLFEILTWAGFAILAQVWGAYGFLALGTILLVTSYALPRHKQYKKDFDGLHGRPLYPENRKAIFPFVL